MRSPRPCGERTTRIFTSSCSISRGTPLHAEFSAQAGRASVLWPTPTGSSGSGSPPSPHLFLGWNPSRSYKHFSAISRGGTARVCGLRTTLAGWRRYKNHPDERIRRRFAGSRGNGDHLFCGRRGSEAVLPEEPGSVRQDVEEPQRNLTASSAGPHGFCSDRRSLCLVEDLPAVRKATGQGTHERLYFSYDVKCTGREPGDCSSASRTAM